MKYLIYAVLAAALCAAAACSHRQYDAPAAVDKIEIDCREGRYASAQGLADSLVIGPAFSQLNTQELCRLSLALMLLGENSAEPEANTAFAARCLNAALTRDSDSTALYIKTVNNEDRATLLMLKSLNEASHTAPADEDSLYYENR